MFSSLQRPPWGRMNFRCTEVTVVGRLQYEYGGMDLCTFGVKNPDRRNGMAFLALSGGLTIFYCTAPCRLNGNMTNLPVTP